MKRHLLSVAAIATAVAIQAATLTPSQALQRLNIGKQQSKMLKSLPKAAIPAYTSANAEGSPTIYFFKAEQGGFVLVAADDVARPLIGYTESDINFNNMPHNLRSWLDMWNEIIAAVSANPDKYRSKNSPKPMSVTHQAIEPIVTTEWNQVEPFNNYCPEFNGGHYYSGCVATAMAQAMKVFNYPTDFCKGSISYHPGSWEGDEQLSIDFSKVKFNWGDMLDSYNGEYSAEQADAVATLMLACGYSVKMDYTPNVSNSYGFDIVNAGQTYFGYSRQASYLNRDYYPTDEWDNMLLADLDAGYPLIYTGASSSGGHAFICDGYDGEDLFHINWGWGGIADGYYVLDILDPQYIGPGGYSNGYRLQQGAVFNFHPAVEGETIPSQPLYMSGALDIDIDGTTMSLTGSKGYAASLYSTRDLVCDCAVRFTKLDENMQPTGVPFYRTVSYNGIPLSNVTLPGMTEIEVVTCPVSDLENGVYEICFMVLDKGATVQEWKPVLSPANSQKNAYIHADNGVITASPGKSELSNIEFVAFDAGYPVFASRPMKLRAEIKNNSDKAITLYFTAMMLSGENEFMSNTIETVTIQAGETVEHTWLTKFEGDDNPEIGKDAEITLFDYCTNLPLECGTISTKVAEYAPEIEIGSFILSGSKLIDGVFTTTNREITFKGSVTARKGLVTDCLALAIINPDGSLVGAQQLNNGFCFINEGESFEFSLPITFQSAKLDDRYTACIMSLATGELIPVITTPDGTVDPSTMLSFVITEPTVLPQPKAPFDFISLSGFSMYTQKVFGNDFTPIALDDEVEQYKPGFVSANIKLQAENVPDDIPTMQDYGLYASLVDMYGNATEYKTIDLGGFFSNLELYDDYQVNYDESIVLNLGGRYQRNISIPGMDFKFSDTVNFTEDPIARYSMSNSTVKVGEGIAVTNYFNTGYPYDVESITGEEKAYALVMHHDIYTDEPEEVLNESTQLKWADRKKEYLAAVDTIPFGINDAPVGRYTATVSANWGNIETSFEFQVIDTLRAEVTLDKVEYAPSATINATAKLNYTYPFIHATGDDELPTVRIAASLAEADGLATVISDTTEIADAAFAYNGLDMSRNLQLDLSGYDFANLPEEGKEYVFKLTVNFNDADQGVVSIPVLVTKTPTGIGTTLMPNETPADNAIYRIDGVKVDTTRGNLAPGIYVSRGRKIIITK